MKFQSFKAKKGFIISKIVLNLLLHQPREQTLFFVVSHSRSCREELRGDRKEVCKGGEAVREL